MDKSEFDVVVCGAGIMGSAAAASCAARGVRVALLERFSFLHTRGSSHGPSRIVRRSYPTPLYTSLMSRAYELWAEVDRAAGHTEPLLRKCGGGLDIVCANSNVATSLRDACASADVPIIELFPDQALYKYGLHLRSHELAIFQPDSCIVDASRATSVFQDLARTRGATLIENAEVTSLHIPVANVPCILTVIIEGKLREIRAKHVILTPGAWAGPLISKLFPLLPSIPFEVWQCTTMFFERNKTASSFEPLPVLIEYGDRPLWTSTTTTSITSHSTLLPPVYSCPVIESGGQRAKFAVHMGVTTTADTRDNVPNIATTIKPVQEWLRVRLPDFNADLPIDATTCLYTMTPDEDFVIDTIISPRIILAAGFSGHGFKFAPLIGELLSALATGDVVVAVATALGPQIDSRNVRAAFALNRPALRTRQDLKGA